MVLRRSVEKRVSASHMRKENLSIRCVCVSFVYLPGKKPPGGLASLPVCCKPTLRSVSGKNALF